VQRDPRTKTGATRLLSNKLEPQRHGPHLVVKQERQGADITNTVVVCEVNDLAKTHRFHYDTLSIFVGIIEQAQRLAQLDNLEFKNIQNLSATGNTSIRTDLTFHVRLEDGTLTDMPYGATLREYARDGEITSLYLTLIPRSNFLISACSISGY